MARIIGLDLGAWSVKATIMEGGFSRFDVVERVIEVIPQDGTTIPSIAQRLEAASRLLEGIKLDDSTAFGIAYPIDNASMRWVQMPFTDKAQIAQTLSRGRRTVPLISTRWSPSIVSSEAPMMAARTWPLSCLALALGNTSAHSQTAGSTRSRWSSMAICWLNMAAQGRAIIDIGHERTVVTVAQDVRRSSAVPCPWRVAPDPGRRQGERRRLGDSGPSTGPAGNGDRCGVGRR